MGEAPQLPNGENRTTVIGSTGSGKTVFGTWLLSTRSTLDFLRKPVVIFDWKRDKLLNSLGAQKWGLHQKAPHRPGLYIVKCPIDDVTQVDLFLDRCFEAEDMGLFFDEAAELKKSRSVNRVMKQGRSKNISCISCTQRPVDLPRSVFSEAEYFAILRLNDLEDLKEVRRFAAARDKDDKYLVMKRRDEHNAFWYDTTRNRACEFSPVPAPAQIRASILWASSPQVERKVI